MIQMDVVLGCIGIVMIAGTPELMGRGVLVFLVFPVVAVINAARKILFKSLYGNEAFIYQSLPVNSEEMVIAKVSVMTAVSLIMIFMLILQIL